MEGGSVDKILETMLRNANAAAAKLHSYREEARAILTESVACHKSQPRFGGNSNPSNLPNETISNVREAPLANSPSEHLLKLVKKHTR